MKKKKRGVQKSQQLRATEATEVLNRDRSFLHQSNKMLLLLSFVFFFFASIANFWLICCQFHMDVCSLTDWRDGTERPSDRRPTTTAAA
jgi:hypothetical protein